MARSEVELVETAQRAITHSEWVVGECAAEWCDAWAKGRTFEHFGALIGMTGDQVSARVRVWKTFHVTSPSSLAPHLTWSHYNVAVAWDDSAECLAWANENQATVAEMRAWRRMIHGDDLSVDESEPPAGEPLTENPFQKGFSDLRDSATPRDQSPKEDSRGDAKPQSEDRPTSMATLGDDSTDTAYAPFRSGSATATKPRSEDDPGDGATRDAVLIRKTCVTVGKVILKTDDARQFVTELLAECWRNAQGDTAAAIKAFIQDKPLCR